MRRLFIPILCLFVQLFPVMARATVELARQGEPPQAINEVYLQDGVDFLALDDVLPALGLSGSWDSVRHIYTINTPAGKATLFPGGHYLNLGDRFLPLSRPARFIDGRLRIPEDFVTGPLAQLLGGSVYYRNLQPLTATSEEGSPIDQLFAFLLKKRQGDQGPALRAVAIDPGHGGQDPGAIGDGLKEKDFNLALAKDLEKEIKMQLGIPVYMSRDADYAPSPEQRLKAAEHPDVDALLLLHAEAALAPSPSGVMLFVRPADERDGKVLPASSANSMRLARDLETALRQASIPVAGVYAEPLLPLGRGDLPTVLVEAGYLSNPADLARLGNPAGRQALADALFAGLKAFSQEKVEKSP